MGERRCSLADRLTAHGPHRPAGSGGGWGWLGAHGGAGVSTLCRLVPGGVDLDRRWPTDPGLAVVVVCRSHASGLHAAIAAAGAATNPLVGLVVVSDQPSRLPRGLAELGQAAAAVYPALWQIPYVPAWRVALDPAPADCAGPVGQLADDLAAAARLSAVPVPARPGRLVGAGALSTPPARSTAP